jgi:hypothetical protein
MNIIIKLRGSVDSANEANVSMIKFTQSNWILVSGDSFSMTPLIKTINTATILTVI